MSNNTVTVGGRLFPLSFSRCLFPSNIRHQGTDLSSDDTAAIHNNVFKRDAIRIALSSGLTTRQVASDLEIGPSILSKWVSAFSQKSKILARDAELLREKEPLRNDNRIIGGEWED